jgi:phospholipid/cholesterol/gamma-HCH transport system substrate-binding protein
MTRIRTLVAGAAVVAIVIAVGVVFFVGGGTQDKKLTAYFSRTVGLYHGNDVDIRGVKVGKVTDIKPAGKRVKVTMTYDGDETLPKDVHAVLVPPQIVSPRYIALTPVYKGGAKLADGATLSMKKTATPLELDQIFRNTNDLLTALGPNGANKNGALSKLVDVGAANLKGNGKQLHDTLAGFADAVATLSHNRKNLFGTVTALQKFTTTLANSDQGVRRINGQLADVATYLSGERKELGEALANLATALGQVHGFVKDNRKTLTTDISKLNHVTNAVLSKKKSLVSFLDVAPLALLNLGLLYDPNNFTLDTRAVNLVELPKLLRQTICNQLDPTALNSISPALAKAVGKLKPKKRCQAIIDGLVAPILNGGGVQKVVKNLVKDLQKGLPIGGSGGNPLGGLIGDLNPNAGSGGSGAGGTSNPTKTSGAGLSGSKLLQSSLGRLAP